MNNNMPELQTRPGDWASRIQIHGTLQKKPFGHQSNKWSRRFFMVKDGFLLYYADNERKEFSKRQHFNIHPKGAIPLGECNFETIQEASHPFCFQVNSAEVDGRLVLAAESDYERSKWMEVMEKSRRVTWKNTMLGEKIIQQLESQGLQMAREKQDYFDRLQTEVNALSEERERSEELERINQELEKERLKMEKFTEEIKEEYDKIRDELAETVDTMRCLDEDRIKLSDVLTMQQSQLETLAEDKDRILKEMKDREAETSKLSQEKNDLSQTMSELSNKLKDIEQKTESLLFAKAEAEQRLQENEEKTEVLEEEKQNYSEHAQELQSTIKDLIVQKELTEKELREEIKARIGAEIRLQNAEMSLSKLELALADKRSNIQEEVKEEMTVNVKKLKQFFEDLAAEARFAAEKPIIMRNAVFTRKTMARRAKTLKFTNRKRSSMVRPKSLGDDLDGKSKPMSPVRRAATSVQRNTRERLSSPEPDTVETVVFEDHL